MPWCRSVFRVKVNKAQVVSDSALRINWFCYGTDGKKGFISKWKSQVDSADSSSPESRMERSERLSGIVEETIGLSETGLKHLSRSKSFSSSGCSILIGHFRVAFWFLTADGAAVIRLLWQAGPSEASCASLVPPAFNRHIIHLQDHLSAIVRSHEIRTVWLNNRKALVQQHWACREKGLLQTASVLF